MIPGSSSSSSGSISGSSAFSFSLNFAGYGYAFPCPCSQLNDGGFSYSGPQNGLLWIALSDADLSSSCSGSGPLLPQQPGQHVLQFAVGGDGGAATAGTYPIEGYQGFVGYGEGAGVQEIVMYPDGGLEFTTFAQSGSIVLTTVTSGGGVVDGTFDVEMNTDSTSCDFTDLCFGDAGVSGSLTGTFQATYCPAATP